MTLSLDELTQHIQAHQLPVAGARALDTGVVVEPAFAMSITAQDALAVWRHFRTRADQTSYYPLLTEVWGGDDDDDDFFSRYYYQHEQAAGQLADTRPAAIIDAALHADRATFLDRQEARQRRYLLDALLTEPERTLEQFGAAPSAEEIQAAVVQHQLRSPIAFERWLFGWERRQFGDDRALRCGEVSYLDWFDAHASRLTLLLVPVPEGWNTLAYIHWYGAHAGGTPVTIQFLEHWHRTYQAELVANYGTMLQFVVGRRPATPEEAFRLAWEHVALAECTVILPGVSIREYARALLSLDRWFLHERP